MKKDDAVILAKEYKLKGWEDLNSRDLIKLVNEETRRLNDEAAKAQRIIDEKAAELKRKEDEKAAELKRKEDEKAAELKRKEDERKANDKKVEEMAELMELVRNATYKEGLSDTELYDICECIEHEDYTAVLNLNLLRRPHGIKAIIDKRNDDLWREKLYKEKPELSGKEA